MKTPVGNGKRNVVENQKEVPRLAHRYSFYLSMANGLLGSADSSCYAVLAVSIKLGHCPPIGDLYSRRRTVDAELGVSDNLLDLTVGLEVGKRFPGERAVDLQTIDEGGDGDEAVGLDILLELVVGLLVEDNSVLGLVLDYVGVSGGSV
jgi:hypothetical protein